MYIKWIPIISIVILFLGIPAGWPYAYYQLLRWTISIFAAILAYNFHKQEKTSWTWIFVGIAILFNPIAPVYLNKGTWVILDIISAITFGYSIVILSKQNKL